MVHIVYKSDVIDPTQRQAVAFDNLAGRRQVEELPLTALALGGHPLGQAFAAKHGAATTNLIRRWRPISNISFNPTHKYQAHLYNHPTQSTTTAFLTGAPEILLEKSSLAYDTDGHLAAITAPDRHHLLQKIAALAAQYHLVGIAARRHLASGKLTRSHLTNLALLGVLLIDEPLQPNLPSHIDKFFTGDHPATAAALAQDLGLVANPDVHLAATELEHLNDHELTALLPRINVFSRLDQLHTQRLLRLYGAS